HHRHHREQRGVGQSRCAVDTAISEKTLQQEAPERRYLGNPRIHVLSLPMTDQSVARTRFAAQDPGRIPAFRDHEATSRMTDATLYHNPRCSKSRAALELLQARGVEPTI